MLAVGGAHSTSGPLVEDMMREVADVEDMMREVADDVVGLLVDKSGHWLPDEAPAHLAAHLVRFLERATATR